MFYPGLIHLTCDNCLRYQYRFKPLEGLQLISSFEPVYGRDRNNPTKLLEKEPGTPSPCYRCPKRNPQEGRQLEREIPRASAMLTLYSQTQATHAKNLPDELDPLFVRNLGLVEQVVQAKRQHALLETILPILLAKP